MFLNQEFYPRGCPLTCGHYARTIDDKSFEVLCPNAERACREAVWLEHRHLLVEQVSLAGYILSGPRTVQSEPAIR